MILPSRLSLDSIFTTGSDYSKGLFVFKPNVQYAKFPFKYYAMKTSMTGKITLTISSDANFGSTVGASNVRSVEIKTPIKPEIVSY